MLSLAAIADLEFCGGDRALPTWKSTETISYQIDNKR
jgi:hypothetical protein